MKVFVATSVNQGVRAKDEMNCIDGELVWMVDPCPLSVRYPDGPCPCGRTFRGMYSDGVTTTALVRDIDRLTREEYELALKASHDNRPGCTCPFDAPAMVDALIRRAARWPVGTIVGRRLQRVVARDRVST